MADYLSKTVTLVDSGGSKRHEVVRTITTRASEGTERWVPRDSTRVAEITIRENGEYVPVTTNLHGYAKVNVMVAGGGAAYVRTDKLFAGPSSEEELWPLDGRDYPKQPAARYVVPPASTGGIIRGIDPETGNIVTVFARDQNGVPTLTFLPDSAVDKPTGIVVIDPPDRTEYEANQTIDYGGMVIALVRDSGALYTSDDYPNGLIEYKAGASGPTSEHPKRNYRIGTPTKRFESAGYVSVTWLSPFDFATYETTIRLKAASNG